MEVLLDVQGIVQCLRVKVSPVDTYVCTYVCYCPFVNGALTIDVDKVSVT